MVNKQRYSSRHQQDQVIGGVFGLQLEQRQNQLSTVPFLTLPRAYFLSARCALKAVAELTRVARVWLPSYLCPSMVDSFRDPPRDIRFYPVSKELRVAEDGWTRGLGPQDLVVAIHYFGFELEGFPWQEVCASGAILVEDSSQALFRVPSWNGSYGMVFSARKFIGTPDGAVFVGSQELIDRASMLKTPPREWWAKALEMTLLRRDFDQGQNVEDWFPLFRQVETSYPVGPFRASDVAVAVMESCTDYSIVAKARRRNFLALLSRLEDFALYKTLPEDCVPLGFPVVVPADRRAAVLEHLYAGEIYPPIHWNLNDLVEPRFAESHTLSNQILTLIIDQRYGDEAITREAESFLEAISKS
jgi:hypothetical protein